ncbi:hypothetical protein BU24DRAFT_199998 [Aaosphaeria arxii CBS 175.79]|uniref:Uncharacterized protein n=1 Tax=Aaosphaeria arxii CBS 175.79 TaxID=1450172 RepID=A0A6A5XU59_9PLEO|nr:uncharacterized protein BU24DRAFT_199998 [Aaosphaeria arxii CBS 175.79]KAF2016347.1 hypothetical protein BU24DRAFT_199998 [Aaosphaeria arxii CBS 175.79]
MANQTKMRTSAQANGGKLLHEHMLSHDMPRHRIERSPSDDTTQGSKQHNGSGSNSQSNSEDEANEDDEEDSSASQEDDKEDDDDADIFAPSHGLGKGKGLRPAIRIEPADGDDSHDEVVSHGAGRTNSNDSIMNLFRNNANNKKRTFSNLSSTSVLFGDEDGPSAFPRPKMARRLSRTVDNGLLTYQEASNGVDENAIASSDDENNDLDDDEDYSGVLEVPDDETDPEMMEQEEEHFIIQEEEQHGNDLFSAQFDLGRRHSIGSYGSDDILSLSMGDPLTFTDLDFAPTDHGFGQFFEAEPPLPASPEPLSKRKFSDSSAKRVRFDDEVQVSDSSSDTSSELDSSTFPDLFMEQEKLPPSIYQELLLEDIDSDVADLPSDISEQSYWDVGQDEPHNLGSLNANELDDSSDPGSSGYETDMGDTTDEYDSDFGDEPPNPRTPRTKRSVLRRPASAPTSRVSSPNPFRRGSVVPPPRGVFIHDDSSKAIAVTDRFTKTITFYRPRSALGLQISYDSTSSTANNSPRASLLQLNASDSEINNDMLSNAFMGSDIMFSGLFGNSQNNALMFGGDSIGPPEAFYPFVNIENGNVMSDDDEYDDDEDYEDDLNLADFMDFGPDGDDTDIDQDDETDVPTTPATARAAAQGSTPAQPTPYAETPSSVSRNVSDAMLEHFDRANVTAFRNNQNRYRDIARLPHDPHVRASVSKPIRSGRSAEALMSPLRKRSTMPRKHRNSPFAGVAKATSRLQSSVMNSRRGPPMGTFS